MVLDRLPFQLPPRLDFAGWRISAQFRSSVRQFIPCSSPVLSGLRTCLLPARDVCSSHVPRLRRRRRKRFVDDIGRRDAQPLARIAFDPEGFAAQAASPHVARQVFDHRDAHVRRVRVFVPTRLEPVFDQDLDAREPHAVRAGVRTGRVAAGFEPRNFRKPFGANPLHDRNEVIEEEVVSQDAAQERPAAAERALRDDPARMPLAEIDRFVERRCRIENRPHVVFQ